MNKWIVKVVDVNGQVSMSTYSTREAARKVLREFGDQFKKFLLKVTEKVTTNYVWVSKYFDGCIEVFSTRSGARWAGGGKVSKLFVEVVR